MTRVSVFSAPFLLGFDAFEERIDRLARSADGYPPYNIERTPGEDGAERFLISIAVAGFSQAELEVMVEDNQLQVRGRQKEEAGKDFLHRGIAARQFQRSFLLADGMQVKDATLGHGMLVIALERPRAAKIARKIDIRSL
ncbi:MAG: heat-shock protein Hsp20 [Pelagibacterium sp. SCN 63-23]|nr:MAG: heat-shock protein Hsp20 [Pelagibacterium sp. SCN 63-23]